jgi:predicted ATPase
VVLLSGEAGIGKSRLTAALLERLAGEPHTRLRYFCSPQHSDSALYPIIRQMEGAAGLAHDDSPQARLDKLDALLAQTSTSAEDSALFAEMLSLANDGRYPVVELTPQQRRQRTLEALTAQIKALTRASPVLMIFEDAHWIDPTSLESLGRAVDQIRTMRVLLSVTFRPEFDPPWIGRPYVTALTINRLDQRDTDAMIDHLVVNKGLPANIRQDIIERADGIPLFVEEMTKAVLESEGEGEARRTDGAVSPPVLAVPASLQASLMARLDRLGRPRRLRRSGRRSGASSPMPCCPRWCTSRMQSWNRRWTVSLRPACCFGRARRRMRPTCSSTPWCRTRHMALFSAINARSCMRVSPRCSNKNSRA